MDELTMLESVLESQSNGLEIPVLNYQDAKQRASNLILNWSGQINYVKANRKKRFIEVDVEQLQRDGKLLSDETLIPIRVIDTNIKREQPVFVRFLTQSDRLAIFEDESDPSKNNRPIEDAFSRGMRYLGWATQYYKCIDGAQLFGWDAVEIEFDSNKPLHVGVSHIGNENLIFPRDAKNIQACEMVLIGTDVTKTILQKFVKDFGFNATIVEEIMGKLSNEKDDKTVKIYKMFYKLDGIVQVAWYYESASDYLKSPIPLFLGIKHQESQLQSVPVVDPITGLPTLVQQEVPIWVDDVETDYPIKIYVYDITERPCVVDNRGRAFLDETRQEAQTGLWTSLINGCLRASNVYGSPEGDASNGAEVAQLEVALKHGYIYNKKINLWSPPWPDPMIVKAANAMDTQTQQETGQVAFAVNNRADSAKTATEVTSAEQQQQLLSGVKVFLLSQFIQEVCSASWRITQSQALQNLIVFLPKVTQLPDGTSQLTNDVETISRNYLIKAAGDVDVVRRDQKLSQMQQMWQIISATPLAIPYLMDILKIVHPEDAERYNMILQAGDQKTIMLQQMGEVLRSIVTDESGAIKPEFKQYQKQLQQLEQQTMAVIQGGMKPEGEQNGPVQQAN